MATAAAETTTATATSLASHNSQRGSDSARSEKDALDALCAATRPAANSVSVAAFSSSALTSPSAAASPSPQLPLSSTLSLSTSAAPSSASRCQRVLESGHVFTRHYLSGRDAASERVVLFVVRGVLYVCRHSRQQSRYRHPFLSLPLSSASVDQPLRVYMGKQTAALRLVPADLSPERRCFALCMRHHTLELEAPGSGDVRYWLRSLYELLTRVHSLHTAHSLIFVPPQSPALAAESLERAERRMRQLRMDGQRARRREEAERRLNGQQRLADEKALSDRAREEQCTHLRLRWLDSQHEAEHRVAAVSSPSSRVLVESQERLDGDRRMEEQFRREADVEGERRRQFAAQPPQHVPALASEYAKLNQRCTALQTHTRAPLLAHTPTQGSSDGAAARRRLGTSKSTPALSSLPLSPISHSSFSSSSSASSCGVAPPPAATTRSVSGSALSSPSPLQHRLLRLMPHATHPHSPSLSASTSATHLPAAAATPPSSLPASSHNTPNEHDSQWSELTNQIASHTLPSSSPPPPPTPSVLMPPCSDSFHGALTHDTIAAAALSSPTSQQLSSLFPSLFSPSNAFFPPPYAASLMASSFEPSSPSSVLPYDSTFFSPTTHCLPVTAVYSVHTASHSAQQRNVMSAALSSMSGLSRACPTPAGVKCAAAMPDPNTHSSTRRSSISAADKSDVLSSASSPLSFTALPAPPSSILFHCAIELPSDVNPPPSASVLPSPHSSRVGGSTHFHFHLHASSSPSPSSSRNGDGGGSGSFASWPPALLSPPPYTAVECAQ